MPRLFLGGWIMVSLAAWLGARNESEPAAAALLTRVAERFEATPHLEVTAYTRELRAEELQDAESASPVYRVSGAEYRRMVLTMRRPGQWRIVSQSEHVMRGQAQPSRTFVFGGTETGESAVLVLNTATKAPARISIPAGMFKQEVSERAGNMVSQDPLFRLLVSGYPQIDPLKWAVFFGDGAKLKVDGTEEVNGVQLTRIASTWPPNTVTWLWVDTNALKLVRRLEAPSGEGLRFFRSAEIKETIYSYDFDKGAADADFDLEAGWAAASPNIASAAGFSPSAELFAALTSGGTIKPEAPEADAPKGPRTPKTPRTPSPAAPFGPPVVGGASPSQPAAAPTAPAPAPAVEEQQLTPQQMEAIVLVEGDDGVGSGFVARIRDVDFVVTNQHVIGGNETLRITTVRGVPIKVGAIYGAVGRDIAILRIEGANIVPSLKIADDPLKTAKFGDKVAVVGNRRGGGVATQVTGVVRGIGPDKIEVDAPFQPGNSGSPIVHVPTGEVIGLATYSLTRKLDALDGSAGTAGAKAGEKNTATEQRWFGHRADGVARWESIDLVKWRAQAKRVEEFSSDSEAIYYAMYGRFSEASSNVRVRKLIDRLEERANKFGSSRTQVTQEVQEFFRSLKALAETGVKDLKTGDYYDYFRTNMYWETSITEQLRAREEITLRLDRAAENSASILEKLRR